MSKSEQSKESKIYYDEMFVSSRMDAVVYLPLSPLRTFIVSHAYNCTRYQTSMAAILMGVTLSSSMLMHLYK